MPGSKNIRYGLIWIFIGAVLTGLSYLVIPGGSYIFFYGALVAGGLQLIIGLGQGLGYMLKGEEGQNKAKARGLHKAVVQSMVSVALADGEVKDEEVKSIIKIYKNLFHHEISEDDVWSIIESIVNDSDFDIQETLVDVKSILDSSMKNLIVRASFFVASADGEIHEDEKDTLLEIVGGLARGTDEVTDILDDDIRAILISSNK